MGANKQEDDLTEPTRDGRRLMEMYLSCVKDVEMNEEQLLQSKINLETAKTDLSMWLMPPDMKVGEVIGMWLTVDKDSGKNFRNFIQITLKSKDPYEFNLEIKRR